MALLPVSSSFATTNKNYQTIKENRRPYSDDNTPLVNDEKIATQVDNKKKAHTSLFLDMIVNKNVVVVAGLILAFVFCIVGLETYVHQSSSSITSTSTTSVSTLMMETYSPPVYEEALPYALLVDDSDSSSVEKKVGHALVVDDSSDSSSVENKFEEEVLVDNNNNGLNSNSNIIVNNTNQKTKKKKSWKVFSDLQCPFCKKMATQHMKDIQNRFDSEYEFTFHLTSLVSHQQAFTAQCGASLIETVLGRDAMFRYVDACFENQELYTNQAMVDSDASKSDIDEIFASIAEKANIFDTNLHHNFTKAFFLEHLHNWELAVKPANDNVKYAYRHGVWGSPLNVIDGKLIAGTESAWGPNEWEEKLKTLE